MIAGIRVSGPNGEEIKEDEGILVWDTKDKDWKIITYTGKAYTMPMGYLIDGEELHKNKHQHKVVPLPKEKCYCIQLDVVEVPRG